MEKAFNDREAAIFLGLSHQTLRNMRTERRGPAYHKVGRRVVYRLADLEAWLSARRVEPEAGDHRDRRGGG